MYCHLFWNHSVQSTSYLFTGTDSQLSCMLSYHRISYDAIHSTHLVTILPFSVISTRSFNNYKMLQYYSHNSIWGTNNERMFAIPWSLHNSESHKIYSLSLWDRNVRYLAKSASKSGSSRPCSNLSTNKYHRFSHKKSKLSTKPYNMLHTDY